MHANVRYALFAGALFAGIAAQGCSAPTEPAPHFVHARVEVRAAPSSAAKTTAAKTMNVSDVSRVQIVEVNGVYEGCLDREGPWSVAVGTDTPLDNPPLTVVQNDDNCQLVATEVRADQLYEAAVPIEISWWAPLPASSFAPQASDGGADQIAFYASGYNTDPGYPDDFTLVLFYSTGPSDTSGSTGATFTTSSASLATGQVPAPDYAVDLSQMAIQVDGTQTVASLSGTASFSDTNVPGIGYVIDNGTLPSNPTFGQLDALYNQSSTPIQDNFSVNALDLLLPGAQLPAVRNVVIAGAYWGSGVTSYQVISITFEQAHGLTEAAKRVQTVLRK